MVTASGRARVIAILQARMGSSRLPGKVLMDLAGQPMLARIMARCSRTELLDEIVVATGVAESDNPVADLCRERGWSCFRGSDDDVLDRYYRAAKTYSAEVVVRLSADNPLIDAEVIDLAVKTFLTADPRPDYASTTLAPQTFPVGMAVEVISFEALERAWHEDTDSASREHVTPFIYRHPETFRLDRVSHSADLSQMRWTVDTREDMEFVRRVFDHFGGDGFTWHEALRLLAAHPSWSDANRHVRQKVVP